MYQIDIKGHALKEIGKLPQRIREQTIQEIEFLKTNPRPHGSKKLSGSTDRWRIRIGDYRILY